MMGRVASYFLAVAAAATAALAAPALAQCRLCEAPAAGPPDASGEGSMTLEIEAGLDFDRLVLLGPAGGTAVLRPDGTREVSGAIQSISARAMVGQALVTGQPGRAIRIDLPRRIDLYSIGGARISIEDIATDLPPAPRLDPAGRLSFRFGGRLRIDGELDGEFRGDLPITAEYW